MARYLFIDTSIVGAVVAVVESSSTCHRTVSSKSHLVATGSAQQLPDLVSQALSQAACSLSALDGIVVSPGPGSFTGIKVGLAFVAGLTVGGTQKPSVYGFSAAEGVTRFLAQREGHPVAVFLAQTKSKGFVCLQKEAESASHVLQSLTDIPATIGEYRCFSLSPWPELVQWCGQKGIKVEELSDLASIVIAGMAQSLPSLQGGLLSAGLPEPKFLKPSTAEEQALKENVARPKDL